MDRAGRPSSDWLSLSSPSGNSGRQRRPPVPARIVKFTLERYLGAELERAAAARSVYPRTAADGTANEAEGGAGQRPLRIGELWRIREVKALTTNLKTDPFGNLESLEQRQAKIEESGPGQGVPSYVSRTSRRR